MLVVRHERPLYSFLLGHRLDSDTAADLTQETFLKAYRAIDGYDSGRSSFKTWLYTIAANLVRDLGRRRQVRTREIQRLEGFQEASVGDPGPEERTVLRDQVERLLSGVDEEARKLLTMKFLHDLEYQAIAEVTGLEPVTIRSKVHRALKRIKARADEAKSSPAEKGGES